MSQPRPKLLVLTNPGVPAAEIAACLVDLFDVTVQSASAETPLDPPEDALVLADAETWRAASPSGGNGIFEKIGDGICLASSSGEELWANGAFREYDEQTRARISSACRTAAARFNALPAMREGDTDSARGPERFEVASGDENTAFEVAVSPAEVGEVDGQRAVVKVVAIVSDITERKRIAQKMHAIDRAGSELVRLDAALVRKKHVGERLGILEDKVIKFAHELLQFDHFSIRLVDERTNELELVIATGLPPEATEMELSVGRDGEGIMGYVAATGESYLCDDVPSDPMYRTGLLKAMSSLTVPLRLHDRVIGVLNVESEKAAAFSQEDRRFAEMFANHVALALHILDLLVVERCATGESVTGTVEGELDEPLEDILHEADWLRDAAGKDPKLKEHIERIRADVEAIRSRVREVASGPQNILGANRALRYGEVEPGMVGKRVLIADDEERIRRTIRDVLAGRGCSVTVCESGAIAVEAIAASASGPRFDLIISDINMPDKNGYEVFAAARKIDEDASVILITGFGYDPHHSIVRASQEGLRCVLFKPFQIERLLEEVRKALGVEPPAGA